MYGKIPANQFVKMLAMNVRNSEMTPEALLQFVENTLPIVEGGEALDPNLQNRKVTHVGEIIDTENPASNVPGHDRD